MAPPGFRLEGADFSGLDIHAVWFIKDTSIRDIVESPRQTKGHIVEETTGSDTSKGHFG